MKKIKLLFVSAYDISFVRNDAEILSTEFMVEKILFVGRKKNIHDLFYTIIKIFIGVLRNNFCFCWFADSRAFFTVFFSRLFRKKSIVVIGGYEVAKIPEINYGGALIRTSRFNVNFILKYADKILAVSQNTYKEILKNYHPKSIDKIRVVYNGIDIIKFTPSKSKKKLIITVGFIKKSNLQRKGLETFVKAASLLPDEKFVLIGKYRDNSIDYLKSIATSNVTFTGFVSDEMLLDYFQNAKVYVQVSAHEGFGISLAEAMLCECVPVVTDRGAIPEVVGNTGYYVPYDDPEATAEAIKEALNSDKGTETRQRILDNYSLKKRENFLIQEIKKLI